MVGAIAGIAAQILGAGAGAIGSASATKRMLGIIKNQKKENQDWRDLRMTEDFTQRPDAQNFLRKQKEMLLEQQQRNRAMNVVAGGTDEALALQQAEANKVAGETMADFASQAAAHKDEIEQQFLAKDAALDQQLAQAEANKASNIAAAAGQMGSAVSGLVQGGVTNDSDLPVGERTAIAPEPAKVNVNADLSAPKVIKERN